MSQQVGRRRLLTAVPLAGATALSLPALSQGLIEWRMVTSWPRGLPGLGTGAERIAKRIETLSGGRLRIKLYAGGELVPALGCFDAVASGTAEIGHDASYYHLGKSKAAGFFTAMPFGLTANELTGWIRWGGGQELWDRLYEPFGIRAFMGGNTGTQMGGWFRREINAVEDLRGLKIRMPGQGGEVISKLGATVVVLPGGEIYQALQSGAIDAAEWVGPYNDLALGFHQVAKFYYYPGIHEPGAGLQTMVNRAAFDALPADLQQIVQTASEIENDVMWGEYVARSATALLALVEQHGVQLKQFPRAVLLAMGTAAGELVQGLLDDTDPLVAEIARSFVTARTGSVANSFIGEQTLMNARRLDFPYPKG